MPYIVTVYRESHEITRYEEVSRTAVETIEEARANAAHHVDRHGGCDQPAYRDAYELGPAGSQLGPLLDGAVIAVRTASWPTVAADAPLAFVGDPLETYDAQVILAAFNDHNGS